MFVSGSIIQVNKEKATRIAAREGREENTEHSLSTWARISSYKICNMTLETARFAVNSGLEGHCSTPLVDYDCGYQNVNAQFTCEPIAIGLSRLWQRWKLRWWTGWLFFWRQLVVDRTMMGSQLPRLRLTWPLPYSRLPSPKKWWDEKVWGKGCAVPACYASLEWLPRELQRAWRKKRHS